MIWEANSASSLLAVLGVAQSGDVVQLAPGSYGTVTIMGVNLGDVTITSADPGSPAVINFLSVRNSSGLTFSDLDIEPRKGVVGSVVQDSSDIHFARIDFHSPTTNLAQAGSGLTVTNSSNVSVTDSDFHHLIGAVTHINADGLTLSGNKISNMRSDGFIGTGSDNVVISQNTFTDFFPTGGVHPDAIQMWTATDGPSKNITITDNVITRGSGEIIQGIFITNEGGTGYENVTISGNALAGTMFHGITLMGATGAQIENNFVLGYADMVSRITIRNSVNVVEQDNQATAYVIIGNTNHTDLNNKTIAKGPVGDLQAINAWLNAGRNQFDPSVNPGGGNGGFELPDLGVGEGFPGLGFGFSSQTMNNSAQTPFTPQVPVLPDVDDFSGLGGWLFL